MTPEIERRQSELRSVHTQVRWCDEVRFREENTDGVSPGQHLNQFGWWVIGTTIGGNAVVVREDDPAVYFADHTWYHDSGIHYQRLEADRSWVSAPLNPESMRASLFMLAATNAEFVARAERGEIDAILDRID